MQKILSLPFGRMGIGALIGGLSALGYGLAMRTLGGTCTFACDPLVGGPLGAAIGAVALLALRDDNFD
ncbi:hypothetical protein [Vulgatibacter sp.]|uniref:hypothetical protein n=1 Tax=Vulgatibacter sp. TaxID=1971226 RepID=UPI0035677441